MKVKIKVPTKTVTFEGEIEEYKEFVKHTDTGVALLKGKRGV